MSTVLPCTMRIVLALALSLAAGVPAGAHSGLRDAGDAAAAASQALTRAGDAARGAQVWRQACQLCHTIEPGGRHKIGPNLAGSLARPAASAPGYPYSSAMRDAALVWDDATLARFLAYPFGTVAQTKMDYWLHDPADIADVIAYLRGSPAARKP